MVKLVEIVRKKKSWDFDFKYLYQPCLSRHIFSSQYKNGYYNIIQWLSLQRWLPPERMHTRLFASFLPFTLEAPKKVSPNEVPKLVITHKKCFNNNVHFVHFSLFYQLSRDRLQILLLLLRESK